MKMQNKNSEKFEKHWHTHHIYYIKDYMQIHLEGLIHPQYRWGLKDAREIIISLYISIYIGILYEIWKWRDKII